MIDVRGFYAELGISLPGNGTSGDVSASCFANPGEHRREDRDPSGSVSLDTGAWNCRGCGARGGPYDAALALGRAPREAMELLRRFGLVDDDRPSDENGYRTREDTRQLATTEADVARYREQLAGRPDFLAHVCEERGWTPEAMTALGLGFDGQRIIFPTRNARLALVGLLRYVPVPASRNGARKMLADAQSVRELFPAPESFEAGETVYVVEGEPDAVAARSLGLAAVGVPGAKSWRPEWGPRFAGLHVVIVPDCDQPGRALAGDLARDLLAHAASVRLLDLAPEREDGYDLGDYGREAAEFGEAGRAHARRLLIRAAASVAPLTSRGANDDAHGDPSQNGARRAAPSETVLAIRRALLEDAQDTRDVVGPAREEVPGTGGLLYRGVSALIFAERGQGKSTVAVVVGVGAAAAGERVLYLDRENGAALTRERTQGILDANPEWGDPLADGRFVGRHFPEFRSSWRSEDYGEAIAGAGFTVVLYDSTREMLDQLGLDPNSDSDLSAFHALAVTPLRRRGVAVALLDNVGHQETHRPKGSGTKLDAAEVAYKVVTTSRFSAVETGRIAITCTRSRYGDQDCEWSMPVGGGVWEPPRATTESPDARSTRKAREGREAFRLACAAALRERRPQGRDALIAVVRRRGIRRRNATLRDWLSDLAADPTSGIDSGADGYDLTAATPGPETRGHSGATAAADPPGPLAPPISGARAGDPGPESAGGANRAEPRTLADLTDDELLAASPGASLISETETRTLVGETWTFIAGGRSVMGETNAGSAS